MIFSLYELCYIFAIYTFLGWLMEVIYVSASKGGFVNRGFLNGPACPIYGFGALITLLILTPLRGNFFAFFAAAVALTSLLELAAGIFLDKVFHEKWWDYKSQPLNFFGYICMGCSLAWGVTCSFLMYVLHPLVMRLFTWLPMPVGIAYLVITYSILAVDLVITLIAFSTMADNLRMINQLGARIRKISDAIGDNVSNGVFTVLKVKDMRVPDLEELKEKYDNLIRVNKILLNRFVFFFHPLARFLEEERIKRNARIPAAVRKAITEEKYFSTIEGLLSEDCVQEMQKYLQHGDTTTYTHCLAVAYYSYQVCQNLRLQVDIESIARGALLHDLFLYDWHEPSDTHRLHGFYHPGVALANASKYFDLNLIEKDIIKKHMWPLTVTRIPRCREAAIVCLVDKFCSLSETIGLSYKRQHAFIRIRETVS